MTLAQAIKAGPAPDPRCRCGVGEWVAKLDADDRSAFDTTLELAHRREGWTVASFHVLLKAETDFPLGANMLSKHAAGRCSCGAR
jgi:hypothetical protein